MIIHEENGGQLGTSEAPSGIGIVVFHSSPRGHVRSCLGSSPAGRGRTRTRHPRLEPETGFPRASFLPASARAAAQPVPAAPAPRDVLFVGPDERRGRAVGRAQIGWVSPLGPETRAYDARGLAPRLALGLPRGLAARGRAVRRRVGKRIPRSRWKSPTGSRARERASPPASRGGSIRGGDRYETRALPPLHSHSGRRKRSSVLGFVLLLAFVAMLAPVVYHHQHRHHIETRRRRERQSVVFRGDVPGVAGTSARSSGTGTCWRRTKPRARTKGGRGTPSCCRRSGGADRIGKSRARVVSRIIAFSIRRRTSVICVTDAQGRVWAPFTYKDTSSFPRPSPFSARFAAAGLTAPRASLGGPRSESAPRKDPRAPPGVVRALASPEA